MKYDVYVYDAIGQYVDDSNGEDILPVYNDNVIGRYDYELLKVDESGLIIDKHGRRYGNGAYVLKCVVRIYVNKAITNSKDSMITIGVMRPTK